MIRVTPAVKLVFHAAFLEITTVGGKDSSHAPFSKPPEREVNVSKFIQAVPFETVTDFQSAGTH